MAGMFDSFGAAFEPFNDTTVAFHGTRPGARPVAFTVKACVFEGEFSPDAAATAPSNARLFAITFPFTAWRDATPPQIGEWVAIPAGRVSSCAESGGRVSSRAETIWCKVDSAVPNSTFGDWEITATHEPERRPSWCS